MQNPTESDAALWVENVLHGIGDTGAPLFLKLLNSKIIFGGICIAIFDGNIVFVRPKLLYQAMKGF